MEEKRIIPIKHSEDYFLSQLYQSNRPAKETMRILKTLNNKSLPHSPEFIRGDKAGKNSLK